MDTETVKFTEPLNTEDCVKAAIMILEILSNKGHDFDQQLFITCSMLEILKSSISDLTQYNELEASVRQKAYTEIDTMYGLESV